MELTICITVYGRPKDVERCLKSVREHVCPKWPIVVILSEHDDLKFNHMSKLVEYNLKDRNVKIKTIKPTGVYSALNSAILEVETEYFTFCHSDDQFINEINNKKLDFGEISKYDIYTFPVMINERVSLPRIHNDLSVDISINHMCTIFKTSFHRKYLYNTDYRYSADWDAILRMKNASAKISMGNYTFLKFETKGISNEKSIRRLREDLTILLSTSWTRKNARKKVNRILKEIGGYIIGRIACSDKHI